MLRFERAVVNEYFPGAPFAVEPGNMALRSMASRPTWCRANAGVSWTNSAVPGVARVCECDEAIESPHAIKRMAVEKEALFGQVKGLGGTICWIHL